MELCKINGKHRDYTIIIGCGRLGASIAGRLSEENKDVMIIDNDKSSFRKLPPYYGGLTMVSGATDVERLIASDIGKASTLIAVTDNDNVNICAAQMAKKQFNVPKILVRIYDEDKISVLKGQNIDVICPTALSEKEAESYIEIGGRTNAK